MVPVDEDSNGEVPDTGLLGSNWAFKTVMVQSNGPTVTTTTTTDYVHHNTYTVMNGDLTTSDTSTSVSSDYEVASTYNSGYKTVLPAGASYVGSATAGLTISLWFKDYSRSNLPRVMFAMSKITSGGGMNTTLSLSHLKGNGYNPTVFAIVTQCCVSAGPGTSSDLATSDHAVNTLDTSDYTRPYWSTDYAEYNMENLVITYNGAGVQTALYWNGIERAWPRNGYRDPCVCADQRALSMLPPQKTQDLLPLPQRSWGRCRSDRLA
jgi:hypothetical protein